MKTRDKLKQKFLNNLNDIYTKVSYNLPRGYSLPPTTMHFMSTLRCNLRCEMCFFYGRGKVPPTQHMQLTLEEMKKMIDNIAKGYKWFPFKPYLGITGGEPFIRPDIFEIIEHIKKRGFKFSITSNFALLNKEKIDRLLKLKPNSMNISIDGPREVHDKIRGKEGTFDNAIANLKYLRSKNNRMPIRMNTTVSYTNKDTLKDVIGIAKDTNCDLQFTHLWYLDEKQSKNHDEFMERTFGEKFLYPVDIMDYTEEQAGEIADKYLEAIRLGEKAGIKINQTPRIKKEDVKRYYYDKGYSRAKKCNAIWSKLRIDECGNLTPCLGYNFGNLLKDDFSDVLNGKRARRLRATVKKHGIFPGCVKCEWL
jgi:Fe-coproporphyrin III synthase